MVRPTTTLLLALSALTLSHASPTPEHVNRDNSSLLATTTTPESAENDNSTLLVLKPTDGWCQSDYGVAQFEWTVDIPNHHASIHDHRGCGRVYYDKISHRCGLTTKWKCEFYGQNGAVMKFHTMTICTNWDVSEAIRQATNRQLNVDCYTSNGD